MSLSAEERFARLRLARTDRVGPVAFSQLLARHDSAIAALDALPQIMGRSGGSLTPPAPERIEAELAAGERIGARLLVLGDPQYPAALAALDPPPPILWTRGDATLLNRPCIAVVGARIASAGGQRLARMARWDGDERLACLLEAAADLASRPSQPGAAAREQPPRL